MGRTLEVRSVTPPCPRGPALPRPRLHPSRRLARRPPRPARGLRRHGAVHRGLSRPEPAGLRALLLQGRRPSPPSRAGVQRRRHRRQSALDPHLGRAGGQGHLGDDRDAAGPAHRRLQRPAREHASGPARRAHHALAAGAAGVDVPDLARRGAVREAQRSVARRSGGLLRLSRGQRARPAALPRHPGHDGGVQPAHRRAVSLVQVRAGHGGGLRRRHGERERHDAGRLAPRRPGLPRPAVVPRVAHPARAGPPVVRRPGDGGELGELLAQRRDGRVHARAVLGREAGAARRAGLLPGGVPAVPRARRAPPDAARHLQLQQRLPQGRAGPRDAEGAAGARAVLGGDAPLSHPPRLRLGHERRPAAGGAGRHRPEPAVVLVPVDLLGGVSGLRGHGRLRLRRARAHARRAADADRHRHRRQHAASATRPRWSFARRSRSGSAPPRAMSSAR